MDEWIRVREAGAIYGCKDSQVYRLARRGALGPVQYEPRTETQPFTRFWFLRSSVEAARPGGPVVTLEGDWLSLQDAAEYLSMTYGAIRKRVTRGLIATASWAQVPEGQRVGLARMARTYAKRSELDRFAASLYHDRIGILPTHHNPIDLTYAACFIDSEGCILLSRSVVKERSYYHPRVMAVNTHEGVIRWMQETFGGRVYAHRPSAKLHYKPRWDWNICSGHAYQFVRLIRPYMKIKGGQADLLVAYYERLREQNGRRRRAVPEEELAYREEIFAQIQLLNSGHRR